MALEGVLGTDYPAYVEIPRQIEEKAYVWAIDIFEPQKDEAAMVIGCLLADALDGFPVPFYPRCLQKAHEAAALVDFDFAVLQDEIINGIRAILGPEAPALDTFRLQDLDPARQRYG